jgi:hypothetical protein
VIRLADSNDTDAIVDALNEALGQQRVSKNDHEG